MEGSGHGLFHCTIPVPVWRDWEKPLLVEIRTEHKPRALLFHQPAWFQYVTVGKAIPSQRTTRWGRKR